MAINKLAGEVKVFIVQRLACFAAPSVVRDDVHRQFGVSITRQVVECYNPERVSGAKLSQELRQVFEETRKAFLDETSTIGISHRAVRLRLLEAQYEIAEERGNIALAARLLKQAALEMGGAYTGGRGGRVRRPAPRA